MKSPSAIRDGRRDEDTRTYQPVTGEAEPFPTMEADIALEHVLILVRWVTTAVLLMFAIAQPLIGRAGMPTWMLILGFAGYSAAVSLLQRRLVWLRDVSRVAIIDLIVVGALYSSAASPGGPVFALFLLISVSISCRRAMSQSLVYTAIVLIVMAVVSPTLPLWTHNAEAVRDLVTRLIVVALTSIGAALFVRHLNHERRATLAASRAAYRQAELHQLRKDFIASVSHELRTPLTALQAGLGMLQMSLDDRMRGDERHLLDTTRRNSERLRLLVDDLLTYNQLEAGALRLDYDQVDLANVIASAVSAVGPLLHERKDHIQTEIAASLPCVGDARRLEQMVINLLANASEHTPEGTKIRIASAITRDDVLLTISDDGPGMSSEDLESAFQPFHRITPRRQGSGLGLAIARRIAELHRGNLWAQSTVNGETTRGTTFTVALPILTIED